MLKESENFLDFVGQRLSTHIDLKDWKYYLHRLPEIYNTDIAFRLLFDWHWDFILSNGNAWYHNKYKEQIVPLFVKQVELICCIGEKLHGLGYQYQELIKYHARCDLSGKSLLEVGGSLPNDLIFEHLQVQSYVNIESPDYISSGNGSTYSEIHGEHARRKTIYCNAEELDKYIEKESFDCVFSVACFEHIYDLENALDNCYRINKRGGTLFSFFAPIYSHIATGDHGVIPAELSTKFNTVGLHLLPYKDQRRILIEEGITSPDKIQQILGRINFNRIPNRLLYEDYERICTESPYAVLELERQENFNTHKLYTKELNRIRSSNASIGNTFCLGFRILLMK